MDRVYNPAKIPLKELVGKCGIYQLRNIETGHIYVGSSATLAYRIKKHFSKLRNNNHDNIHLQRAWNKYSGHFVAEIIEFCNRDEQYQIEQYWIDRFFGKSCYNLNPTATKPPNMKGIPRGPMSEESKKKLSNSLRRVHKENPELRVRMSLQRIGKNMGKEHVHSKDVVCLETGILFHGISEAGRKLDISPHSIGNCCRGHFNECGGLHFRYKCDYDKLTPDEIQDIIRTGHNNIAVVCLETKEVFDKIIDAMAAHPGANRKNIALCCKGEQGTAGGLHWVYYKDYKKMTDDDIHKLLQVDKRRRRRCICLDTGEIFETLSEATKKLNLPAGKISEVCNGRRNHTGGYHFKYVD